MKVSRVVVAALALSMFASVAIAQTPADSARGAKDVIKAIWEATQVFYQDKGEWPADLKALTDSGHYQGRAFPPYLKIPPETRKEWNFSMDYSGPPNIIRAQSKTDTFKFKGDTYLPLQIDYETGRGVWSGYGIPRYQRDTLTLAQQTELAEDAIETIHELDDAAKVFYQDKGSWPDAVKELDADRYILMQQSIGRQWNFSIIGSPPRFIVAVSTDEMPGGAGRGIIYDMTQKVWKGYGIKE
jgi:hypothetical protein